MKKIVKKIFIFAGFLISALNFSIFTGCSDINTKTAAANGTYKISGNVSLGTKSGASPSYFRSATTNFEIPEDYFWNIVAYKYDSATETIDETTEYSPIFSDGPCFTFSFAESASYQITASLLNSTGSVCAQASEIIDTSETESLAMTASPVFSTVTGSVSLPVSIDTSLSSTISSLEVLWLGLGERTSLIWQKLGYSSEDKVPDEDVEAKIDALNDWQESCENGDFNSSFTFSGNEAKIEIDGIFPGSHSVKLNFNDSTGNTLYSCTEIINVYSGFVTDTWYGTSPYLNNNAFLLTDSLIEKYGTQVVSATKILLYGYDSDYNYNYYLTENASSVTSDTIPTATRDSSIEYNAFCFDGNDDVYYLASVDTLSEPPIYTIKSTNSQKSDITTSKNLQTITYDAKNSALYGASFIDEDLTIYKLALSDGESEKTYTFNLDEDSFLSDFYAMAVYDEKAYLAIKYIDSSEAETTCLCVCDLTTSISVGDNEYSINFTDCAICIIPVTTYSDSAEITDMIYQDGYVYILLRDVELSPSSNLYFYSRGEVLKYNTYQNSITELGGLASYQSPDEKYLYTYNSSGYQWKIVSDEDEKPVLVKASELFDTNDTPQAMFALYSPETTVDSSETLTLNKQYFYGPAKFIAIKPKKLVIADDGVAFYTDSLGAYNYKNANRIVEVDLESFAISGTSDVNIEFDFNGSNGSGYIGTSMGSIFYSQETGYEPNAYYYDTAVSSYTQITDCIDAGVNCIYSTEFFGSNNNIRPVIIEGSDE